MNGKISVAECVTLIVTMIMPTAYLIIPTAAVDLASQDAWLSILIALVPGIGITVCVALFAGSNRSGAPFLDWLGGRTGKTVAFAAGLLLAFHFITNASKALNEFVGYLAVDVMPSTPSSVLIAVTMLIAMYAVGQGIANLARICFLVTAGTAPLYFVPVIVLYSKMHLSYLQPIGESNIGKITAGAYLPACWMSEAAIILLVAPYMAKPRRAARAVFWGVLLAGGAMLESILQSLLLFGPNVTKALQYPSFQIVSIIQYGGFLERVELFFIMIWMVTIFMKISLLLFGAVHCLERAMRLRKNSRLLLWAVGILFMLDASVSWRESFELQLEALAKSVALIGFNVLLPIALWLVSLRPGRGGSQAEEGQT